MAEARAAWTGAYPETRTIPIRVEAAAFYGKPVSFVQVLSIPNAPRSSPASGGHSAGDLVYVTLQLIVLIGLIPFARYNLRLGRGDTHGALRVGSFGLTMGLLAWAACGTHVASV